MIFRAKRKNFARRIANLPEKRRKKKTRIKSQAKIMVLPMEIILVFPVLTNSLIE